MAGDGVDSHEPCKQREVAVVPWITFKLFFCPFFGKTPVRCRRSMNGWLLCSKSLAAYYIDEAYPVDSGSSICGMGVSWIAPSVSSDFHA